MWWEDVVGIGDRLGWRKANSNVKIDQQVVDHLAEFWRQDEIIKGVDFKQQPRD
jgi:hypothetical protein